MKRLAAKFLLFLAVAPTFFLVTTPVITTHAQEIGDFVSCSFSSDPGSSITLIGCMNALLLWAGDLAGQGASITGNVMDFFLFFSTDSTSYTTNNFIEEGWALVRDLANLLFIAAMIWMGFAIMLNSNSGINPKRTIIRLITMALLVNFSLFMAKVAIDTTNILARVMYSQITVENSNKESLADPVTGRVPVSFAIAGKFQPQSLRFAPIPGSTGAQDALYDTDQAQGGIAVIALAILFLNIFMAILFIQVALLFLARTIGLYIVMILGPLAFAASLIPQLKGREWISWEDWIKKLLGYAFIAPIFVFFLYLSALFLSVDNTVAVASLTQNQSIAAILKVLLPFAIVYTILTQAKRISQKLAGEIGVQITKLAQRTVGGTIGFAGGAAALGTAKVAQYGASKLAGVTEKYGDSVARGLSKIGASKLTPEQIQQRQANIQRKLTGAATGLRRNSFDIRKTKAFKQAGKAAGAFGVTKNASGVDFDSVQGSTFKIFGKTFDTKTEGGIAGSEERIKKSKEDTFNNQNTYTQAETKRRQDKRDNWEAEYKQQKKLAKKYAEARGEVFDEGSYRKSYEQGVQQKYAQNENGTIVALTDNKGRNVTSEAKPLTVSDIKQQVTQAKADAEEFTGRYRRARDQAKKRFNESYEQAYDDAFKDAWADLTTEERIQQETAQRTEYLVEKEGIDQQDALDIATKEYKSKAAEIAKRTAVSAGQTAREQFIKASTTDKDNPGFGITNPDVIAQFEDGWNENAWANNTKIPGLTVIGKAPTYAAKSRRSNLNIKTADSIGGGSKGLSGKQRAAKEAQLERQEELLRKKERELDIIAARYNKANNANIKASDINQTIIDEDIQAQKSALLAKDQQLNAMREQLNNLEKGSMQTTTQNIGFNNQKTTSKKVIDKEAIAAAKADYANLKAERENLSRDLKRIQKNENIFYNKMKIENTIDSIASKLSGE